MIDSQTRTTIALGDRTFISGVVFRNTIFTVADDVPRDDGNRIFITGCDFTDCDLSALRNYDIRYNRLTGSKMPPIEVLDLTNCLRGGEHQ